MGYHVGDLKFWKFGKYNASITIYFYIDEGTSGSVGEYTSS
jgi:hypothetical protein